MVLKKQRKQKNHQIARKTVGKERGGEVAKSAHFATSAFHGNTPQLMEQMGEF